MKIALLAPSFALLVAVGCSEESDAPAIPSSTQTLATANARVAPNSVRVSPATVPAGANAIRVTYRITSEYSSVQIQIRSTADLSTLVELAKGNGTVGTNSTNVSLRDVPPGEYQVVVSSFSPFSGSSNSSNPVIFTRQ